MSSTDLNRIQAETQPGELENIQFTYTQDEKLTTVEVTVTLYHEQTKLIVRFEDEDQTELYSPIELQGNIDSSINLAEQDTVLAALAAIATDGYTIYRRPDNETGIVLTAQEQTVTYVFEGTLQFVHVTEKLKLSKGKILPFTQTLTYDNSTEDFVVQVKDTRAYKKAVNQARGTFKVNVSMSQDFETNEGKPLVGSKLFYKNQELSSSGLDITKSEQDVLDPEKKDFMFVLNEKGLGKEGFSLKVPAGAAEASTYHAVMTWDLIQGP